MNKTKFIYLCGPTVYNKVHLGNMRPIITFDLIVRAIKKIDPNVKFIHNITDIDDKIITKAQQEQTTEELIANKYTNFYFEMLKKFNVKTVDFFPKVSDKIKTIETFILKLSKKGFVYESNNSFYFRTLNLKNYGEVSNNSLDNLLSEDSNNDKENVFDFVLWKNKSNEKIWKTSLGEGRPGWHTECAAFIYEKTKNNSLLIHGGGIDLKFPHHENENAQFRALTNLPICQKWLHVGIINYKNQKMSKSIGNILLTDDFLNKYKDQTNPADLFRLLILSSSIKSTIEITDELINSLIKKNNQIEKIINFVILNNWNKEKEIEDIVIKNLSLGKFSYINKHLNELIKKYNSTKDNETAKKIFTLVNFLGFNCAKNKFKKELQLTYKNWLKEIKNKNFKEADKLRNILIKNKIL